jgi:hypothetical protein
VTPIDTSDLGWYRLLLKLYPKAYRQEYADEMLATLQEMFAAAPSARDKRQLVVRIIKDYVLSLSRQNLYATTSSFNAAPYPIKRDTAISASLVAPFFIIFTYNTLSLIVRHTVTLHVHNILLCCRFWRLYCRLKSALVASIPNYCNVNGVKPRAPYSVTGYFSV